MKVLRFGGSINSLTVDTTLYTADNAELLVSDNVIVVDGIPLSLRYKENITKVVLRREITNTKYDVTFDSTDIMGVTYLTIPSGQVPEKEGARYEITLFGDNNEILYKSRGIYTNKDIQNYRL